MPRETRIAAGQENFRAPGRGNMGERVVAAGLSVVGRAAERSVVVRAGVNAVGTVAERRSDIKAGAKLARDITLAALPGGLELFNAANRRFKMSRHDASGEWDH
jgi:hypothetical protein